MIKKSIQVVVLFSVLFGLSNCKKTERDILYNKKYIEEIKEVRKETVSFLVFNHVPGASIAVIKDNELIYSEGFGYASKDLEVPAIRETKFRIGTLSELFTNVLYQKLIEEGTIHPDSSVQHYYPDFPAKKYKLTLNHLAQHTSGIRLPKSAEESERALKISMEKGLNSFKEDSLIYPPGYFQDASYFNYNLLGVAMEKATKKHFPQLLKEYVTDTLKLENTLVDDPLSTIKNRSNFFDKNYIGQLSNASTIDLGHRAPSDGLLSNAEDLAKLGNMYLNSDFLTDKCKETVFLPDTLYNKSTAQSANGWMLLVDRNGQKVYGKSGSVKGGGASILVFPEDNMVIAYACNITSPDNNDLVVKIARIFQKHGQPKNTEEKNK
jgi:CubicO group peptidase (beta-lactamase class C family)